ncbi:MAG: hypothetical protein JWP91_2362, partial [Fibrobacteres bacterium]|nr:hypothetical protein [Fibrobacterota bacterium]
MKNAMPLYAVLASATLFSACLFQSKDENTASAKFEFKAVSSAALAKTSAGETLVIGDTSGVRLTFTEALIHIKKIQLKSESDDDKCDDSGSKVEDPADKDCDGGSEATVNGGPYILNLLTGASTPDIGTLTFPAGVYDRVKIHIHHAEGKDTSSTSLGGNTLMAKGTYSSAGGEEKPFTMALRFNEIIQIRNPAGMNLDADALHTIIVGLNAGQWLRNLNVAGCLKSLGANGAVILNEDSDMGKCLDAEHIIKDNFRTSFKVHKK